MTPQGSIVASAPFLRVCKSKEVVSIRPELRETAFAPVSSWGHDTSCPAALLGALSAISLTSAGGDRVLAVGT